MRGGMHRREPVQLAVALAGRSSAQRVDIGPPRPPRRLSGRLRELVGSKYMKLESLGKEVYPAIRQQN